MDKDKTTAPRKRKTATGKVAKAAAKPRSGVTSRKKAPVTDSATTVTAQDRLGMVRTAAYYRAERRGFAPGHEAEDWLAAEAEVEAQLAGVLRKPSARKTGKGSVN